MKINQAETQDKLYQATYQTEKEDIKRNGKQLQNNTVFAGNLNLMEDPIAKKREEARKEAMGLLTNQFKIDSDIDNGMEGSRSRVDKLREESEYATKEVARLEAQMQKMIEEDGLEEGSEELKSIQEEIKYWKSEAYKSESAIMGENAAVRETKMALLKRTYDMRDASKDAEKIMEAASKEIVDMLKQDAIDKIDEDMEEEQEKAEEIKAEQEEKEKLIEKDKEQKKLEETTKELITADSDTEKSKLQKEIQKILEEQDLIEEDLKGLAVDASI